MDEKELKKELARLKRLAVEIAGEIHDIVEDTARRILAAALSAGSAAMQHGAAQMDHLGFDILLL